MELLTNILVDLFFVLFFNLYYKAFLEIKSKFKNDFLKFAVSYAFYALCLLFFTKYIAEPLLSILALIILGIIIFPFDKGKIIYKIVAAALSFSLTKAIWALLLFITFILTPAEWNLEFRIVISILLSIFANFFILKFIIHKNGIKHINETKIELIFFFLVLLINSVIRMYAQMEGRLDIIANIIFYVVLFAAIVGFVISIINLFKSRKEKLVMANEKHKLQKEKRGLMKKVEESKKVERGLMDEVHTVKKIIPAYRNTLNDFAAYLFEKFNPEYISEFIGIDRYVGKYGTVWVKFKNKNLQKSADYGHEPYFYIFRI